MSDGYAGYTFGEDGTPIEIYDHRDEFVPQPMVEKPRDKGFLKVWKFSKVLKSFWKFEIFQKFKN